jgi:hypothetical protein
MVRLKRNSAFRFLFVATLLLGASGCDDAEVYDGPDAISDVGDDTIDVDAGDGTDTVDPVIEQRRQAAANIPEEVLTYLGEAEIKETTELASGGEGYVFDPASGPQCLRGGDYFVSRKDGETESDDFVFFLQGGGACWEGFCAATSSVGDPGFPGILPILSDQEAVNPFASMNKVYLPYCDGSLFGGDAEYDDDDDGEIDRIHHGIQNLSAGLDVALEHYPNPDRILLTGVSAGGFGTILAQVVLRKAYPEAEIVVFNDSGVGVLFGDTEPDFLETRINEWNINRVIPESCDDCLATGHITPFLDWQLDNDPTLRISAFSNLQDGVIAGVFLSDPEIDFTPEDFENELISEHSSLNETYPDRFNSFLVEGTGHTAIGSFEAFTVGDRNLLSWLDCFEQWDNSCWDFVVAEDE